MVGGRAVDDVASNQCKARVLSEHTAAVVGATVLDGDTADAGGPAGSFPLRETASGIRLSP